MIDLQVVFTFQGTKSILNLMKPARKSLSKQGGFTLIELLVVITIIAVLATIGLASFRGISSRANDARRRGDIQAIAKALEVHFGDAGCIGTYCPIQNSWFSSGAAPTTDPIGLIYCLAYPPGGGPLADAANTGWGTNALPTCPSGYTNINPGANPSVGTIRWKVCTLLESVSAVYCHGSQL